ncbi:MAG: cardiolipin synthase [Oscillospiraceae bacterium]
MAHSKKETEWNADTQKIKRGEKAKGFSIKKISRLLFSRVFIVGAMIALQVVLIVALVYVFSQYYFWVYLFFHIISILVVVGLVSRDENPESKITWICFILFFPLIGGLFYLMLANRRVPAKLERRMQEAPQNVEGLIPDDGLAPDDPYSAMQSRYIRALSGYPVTDRTALEYYPLGDEMFVRMVEELEKAEKYIFLEFFIIRPGIMLDTVLELLRRKVAQGVEVRLMYDDLGSIFTLPPGYDKIFREAGIKLCIFNSFRPHVNAMLNHRDHRKMLVIDGKVAFCGGINLADEYINKLERFGHWKDTGVLLRGRAVWSFVVMYLLQWHFATGERATLTDYRCEEADNGPDGEPVSDGLVQVFGDTPLDGENVTETVYMDAINNATDYIYINTPYLVISNAMQNALRNAALRGVDVRINTPFHYDKWYVHVLTRSHYAVLIEAGVKIYEYTPGFLHGKMFVADDRLCMVGTCNMDFRSFYLHFECSVLMYGSSTVGTVKQDILECQAVSHQVTLEEAKEAPLHIRLARLVLKLVAPLL